MSDELCSRAELINNRIEFLKTNGMHIVYLVTEERDILENLMPELTCFIGDISGELSETISKWPPQEIWKEMVKNKYLVDAYKVFGLHVPNKVYVKPEVTKGKGETEDVPPQTRFFLLQDFHLLDEKIIVNFTKQFLEKAKSLAYANRDQYWVLFIVSPLLVIPGGFEYNMEIIDVPEMDREEIERFLWDYLKADSEKASEMEKKAIRKTAEDFCGLQRSEINRILSNLEATYGCFDDCWHRGRGFGNSKSVAHRRRELAGNVKKEAAMKDASITIMDTYGNVAGMEGMINWIKNDVSEYFMNPEYAAERGIDPPKGVLVAGLPGTGKTQLAKQVAAIFGGKNGKWVPLVQFRMDNILGQYVGQSEANFKRCRKKIEALAPCVVLMDEIEKTFDTENSKNSNDAKMNILSALLDWMQENRKQIFFYATCNNIKLPPELQRDGRFTMRYSAFMPSEKELVEIMAYHIKRTNDERHADGKLIELRKGKTEDEQYKGIAKHFFNGSRNSGQTGIVRYAKDHSQDMFYTGANIEALIQQTNIALANKKEIQIPYSIENYEKELIKAAQSEKSQPYGMTNMRDIVRFWIKALDNKYVDVGRDSLFSFKEFDRNKGEFHFHESPPSEYDRYMRERISGEIEKYYKEENHIESSGGT